MLKRIDGYYDAEASRYGEFQGIEPGFYPAQILQVEQVETTTGRDAVLFSFDIIGGKFVRYYAKDYKRQDAYDRKWRGILRQITDGKSIPFFKGLITAIEDSNPGYKFDWDENKMKGLKVGVGIRREQFEATDGTLKFATRPFTFVGIQRTTSGELQPPKDKLLSIGSGSAGGFGGGAAPAYNPYDVKAENAPKFEPIGDDEDLPF